MILTRNDSVVIVVDMQVRLMPAILEGAGVLAAASRLVRGAARLGVPVLALEHCAGAIGPLCPELALPADATILAKRSFAAALPPLDRRQIVLCGVETHVCLLQTALGLLPRGHRLHVAVDASGSRRASDRDAALRRMEQAGILPVSVEMALFEWLGHSDDPAFRDILAIVKEA